MKFRFREHRGSLKDSMKTVVELETFDDLIKHLNTSVYDASHGLESSLPINRSTVSIEVYDIDPDTRIGWDQTFLVVIENWGPVGYTDKIPKGMNA